MEYFHKQPGVNYCDFSGGVDRRKIIDASLGDIAMEELAVTRLWMAGVVTAMLVFGITAIVGVARQKNAREDEDS